MVPWRTSTRLARRHFQGHCTAWSSHDRRASTAEPTRNPRSRARRPVSHRDRQDDYRDDTLFVVRIENATEPRSVPDKITASFTLWPGGSPPSLDPITTSFREILGESAVLDDPEDDDPLIVEPSPRVRAWLSTLPSPQRTLLRPQLEQNTTTSPAEILAPLRVIWKRFRLDRFTALTPRQQLLLTGTTTPAQLGAKERLALFSQFGFRLMNRLVLEDNIDHAGFIESFFNTSLPPFLRLSIWLASLTNLDAASLRQELLEIREWLGAAARSNNAREIEGVILSPLTHLASACQDYELVQLLDASHAAGDAIRALSEWVSNLQFAPEDTSDIDTTDRPPDSHDLPDTPQLALPTSPSTIDAWVMRLRGIDLDQLVPIQGQLSLLEPTVTKLLTGSPSLQAAIEFTELARQLTNLASSWLTMWPGEEELHNDKREAARIYAAAQAVLGSQVAGLLADSSLGPSDLSEILALVKRNDVLDGAPSWIWLLDDDSPATGPTKPQELATYATALLRPEVRSRIRTLVHHVDELGEPAALRWLDTPPPGTTVDQHLALWYNQVRDFLRASPAGLVSVLKAGRQPGIDIQTLLQDAGRFPYLKDSLSPSVVDEIVEHLNGLPEPSQHVVLAEFCDAVDFYKSNIGDANGATFEVLCNRVNTARLASERSGGVPADPTHHQSDHDQLVLNHNWMIDNSRTRAALFLKGPNPNMQYAVLSVPLVLEATHPRALVVRVEWNYRDIGHDGAWPKDWPRPEPEDAVAIPVYGWRRQDASTYQYCFSASIPIRLPPKPLTRFQLTALVRDDKTSRELAKKQLRWDSFFTNPPSLAVRWRDEASPDYVRDHPIGPQLRANAILQRLRGGSSVAVTAPRRFGKSSLVAYLYKELANAKILTPEPVECTLYGSSTGFDHQRLWTEVSDNFQQLLGSGLDRVETSLPGPKSFDHVRRAARTQGYSAVVLLFDEAQLFFPSASGWDIGSRLKTLLANHWSRTDDPALAPVLFGLVGLPSLSPRAGADAMGLLHPIEHDLMAEAQLRPLIRSLASGLQTSFEARRRLAESAGNLLVLRAMLDSLVQRLEHDERTWANFDDILAVEERLKQDLQSGRQEHVASWIRDVLNSADRVEEWRPLPCFPTAVALALSRSAGRRFVEAISTTVAKLNEWCRSFTPSSMNIVPVYNEARVAEHFLQLKERQIASDSAFASGFLEAWLTGVGRRAAFDDAFQQALYQGAHRQIVVPRGATKIKTGGQATIWRDGDRVYRVRSLGSEQEKQVFLEGTKMLRDLHEIVTRRETGSDHVFEVLEMGLARDGHDAVQVYRWVPGEDLSKREHSLAAEAVIEIGIKLSRAVELLHRHNIVHRDICPRNIVLDNQSDSRSLRPVLIDFGFARLATTPMNTKIVGEHLAPEVQQPRPQWSKAADVYGLGSTLRWLLHPASAERVEPVLRLATAETTLDRVPIEQFLLELTGLSESEQLDAKRDGCGSSSLAAQSVSPAAARQEAIGSVKAW